MGEEQTTTRILIVDPQPLVRTGLSILIKQQRGLDVCGEAESPQQALELIDALDPDMVTVEVSLPGQSGLELIKEIRARRAGLPVLVVSSCEEALYAERVLHAGAEGFIDKLKDPQHVVAAIRRVLNGEVYVSEEIASRLTSAQVKGDAEMESPLGRLSDRELEVFQLIGQGLGTQQIADSLGVSVKTIETHRLNIKKKLNLRKASELLMHAVHWNRGTVTSPLEPKGPDPHVRGPCPVGQRQADYCLTSPVLQDPLPLDHAQPCVVGREDSAAVHINSSMVSREHARIDWDSSTGFVVKDLDSRNGTFLNGYRLRAPCPLQDGDRLCFGNVEYVFQLLQPGQRRVDPEEPTGSLKFER